MINKEDLDKEQSKMDEIRKKTLSNLTEEERNKFAVVERCCKEMADAGVRFYLFPELPHDEVVTTCVWQYNSLSKLTEYNEDGTISQKSNEEISDFNISFLATIWNTYKNQFDNDFNKFGNVFYDCVLEQRERNKLKLV
jgi:hypothetical protein